MQPIMMWNRVKTERRRGSEQRQEVSICVFALDSTNVSTNIKGGLVAPIICAKDVVLTEDSLLIAQYVESQSNLQN